MRMRWVPLFSFLLSLPLVAQESSLDELEAMYQRMYETQAEWGEAQVPHDDLFRGFAEEIGLDMQQYDADYASDEVAARVQRDVDDGLELGVQGTPTFYVDGEPLQPRTYEDFTSAIDAALASS